MASTETSSSVDQSKTTGIPKADFLEDVDKYMKNTDENAEAVLKRFDEQHNKYKFMEYNLNTKKARLKAQIPDIKKSLDIVAHLQDRKDSKAPMETRFLLSDQVYAKARVPPTDKVCLWLGANVMLEYNLDDAEVLLKKNQEAAIKSCSQVEDELSFITEQTTTLEVSEVAGFKSPLNECCRSAIYHQMFSPVRRQRRPLGYFQPESRLELQVEKAIFRNTAQMLRDMCDSKSNHRQQNVTMFDVTNFNPVLYDQARREHAQAITRSQEMSTITPEVRWLLTRSARLERANNAGFSKFRNPVKDRVVSAGGRKKNTLSLERQRSMCNRNTSYQASERRKLQCDILGPSFCTDCTRIQEKREVMLEQSRNFPRLEVHTRSLVAPDRVEKLYLSHPEELFNQAKQYPCGCKVNAELEITTPLVYTPHEVFERILRKNNIDKGNEVIKQEQTFRKQHNNTPVNNSENHTMFYDEKTEPAIDMTVSVTFRTE